MHLLTKQLRCLLFYVYKDALLREFRMLYSSYWCDIDQETRTQPTR